MGLRPGCVRPLYRLTFSSHGLRFLPPFSSLSLPPLPLLPTPASTTAAPAPPVSLHRSALARAPACPPAPASLLLGPRAPQGSHLPQPPPHRRAAPRRPNSFLPHPVAAAAPPVYRAWSPAPCRLACPAPPPPGTRERLTLWIGGRGVVGSATRM